MVPEIEVDWARIPTTRHDAVAKAKAPLILVI
jgi:hypothetical protein